MANQINCKGCIYLKKLSRLDGSIYACHYCIDTGKLRDCPPELCNKKGTNPAHRVSNKQAYWSLKNF